MRASGRVAGSIWKPQPRLSLSEWADTRRKLSSAGTAEPGQWRTSRAEYLRGIMDAVTNPAVRKVVVMKGSQVGCTEVELNYIGYVADQDPSSMLIVLPTIGEAKTWSHSRLAPMIRDTPGLRSLFPEPRSRGGSNTLYYKEFPGGYLALIGANAPTALASRPIRYVLFDEVDRFPISAGSEGSPLVLAEQRQTTFWNAKSVLVSTPTVEVETLIEPEYKLSDMRRFHVPCPRCGTKQTLDWSQVKWDAEGSIAQRSRTAAYQCKDCGILWNDGERWDAVGNGEWVAGRVFEGIAGFHLSQLYSTFKPLADMVRQFLEAQGNAEKLTGFTNTVLGEVWKEQGEKVDAEGLRRHIANYSAYDIPAAALFATAGVDVQGDRLEVEIVAWSADMRSFGVLYAIIEGDPGQPRVWQELDRLLLAQYWTEDGHLIRVRAACIDTGGHHAAAVFKFTKSRFNRNVWPIKGVAGAHPPWPLKATRDKEKRRLWLVGVDTIKDQVVLGHFRVPAHDAPGYCTLPPTYPDQWYDQATVETVVTRYRMGRPYRVWVLPPGKRNEALDCRVYAVAAYHSLKEGEKKRSKVVAKKDAQQRVIRQTPDDDEPGGGAPAIAMPVPDPAVVAAIGKRAPVRRRIRVRSGGIHG